MSVYHPTIGLEIHAELGTRTKMFCACINNPDEKTPNLNICPVCMAHPGTLPVINKEAVHRVLLVGTALGAYLADYTEFDRKNYFYPDIPKGYQISQYKHPLVIGGSLAGVELTRIHLEEDTARSQHEGDRSLVDYNRAGVPLMELVTEPVIHDAKTAGDFARELQLLLRYLGAGEANMEKGEMRVEANISVAPAQGSTLTHGSQGRTFSRLNLKAGVLGTKVEVKNLNSFRSVERAIAYEVARQSKLLEKGEKVVQETRGWDETKQETFSQRKKESSHDYRYFPDPDLPKLILSDLPEFSVDVLKKELPELPWEKRNRYLERGVKPEDADIFVRDSELADLFDASTKGYVKGDLELVVSENLIVNDLVKIKVEGNKIAITPDQFRMIPVMIKDATTSTRAARDILAISAVTGEDPQTVLRGKGLTQQSDTGVLTEIAQKVIDANPSVVADYKAGKESALQFLVGQGMRESKGSANPALLHSAILKALR